MEDVRVRIVRGFIRAMEPRVGAEAKEESWACADGEASSYLRDASLHGCCM